MHPRIMLLENLNLSVAAMTPVLQSEGMKKTTTVIGLLFYLPRVRMPGKIGHIILMRIFLICLHLLVDIWKESIVIKIRVLLADFILTLSISILITNLY